MMVRACLPAASRHPLTHLNSQRRHTYGDLKLLVRTGFQTDIRSARRCVELLTPVSMSYFHEKSMLKVVWIAPSAIFIAGDSMMQPFTPDVTLTSLKLSALVSLVGVSSQCRLQAKPDLLPSFEHCARVMFGSHRKPARTFGERGPHHLSTSSRQARRPCPLGGPLCIVSQFRS
jgi:hypothetical protein